MLVDWTTVSAAVGAVLYFLVAGVVLLRRALRGRAADCVVLYTAVSILWALSWSDWVGFPSCLTASWRGCHFMAC